MKDERFDLHHMLERCERVAGYTAGGREPKKWQLHVPGKSQVHVFREPGVAVGTVIANRPPHRSVRALLTHTALALDHGVEAIMRIGMENLGLRQPPGKQPGQALPVRRTVLATTADDMPPQPRDPLPECAESMNIARHCVVLIVASDDRLEPLQAWIAAARACVSSAEPRPLGAVVYLAMGPEAF